MKYKKLIYVAAAIFLIAANVLTTYASGGVSWYIRKNGNKRPDIAPDQRIIEKYNGFYIDKKVDDSSEVKKLYLTFDAGYENGNVSRVLDVLKKKEVPGAFFLLDHIIIKDTDLVKRMSDEGHLVCNHTKNHKDLSDASLDEIQKNLSDLERIYEQKTGKQMAKYFRFPEGRYSERALSIVNNLGYKSIFWSFAYADWDNGKQPDERKAIKTILDNTHNGAVILLHPTSNTNANILEELIDTWQKMGYSFGTLDELCS